jgi:hypothetical protein
MNRVDVVTRLHVLSETLAAPNGAGMDKSRKSDSLWPSAELLRLPAFNNPAIAALAAGGSSPAPVAGGTTTLPDLGKMPFYVQQGNACGTTTLAEIMSYLGVQMDQAGADNAIRRLNTFTAPEDMIDFARSKGLKAEGYNNGSWEEVKAMIDARHPVQAMVDGSKSVVVNGTDNFSVNGLHYIAITGYGTDPATGEQFVTYHDPNRASEQRMSVSDFEKMWGNVPGGFKNYFIAYGSKDSSLPPGRNDGIQAAQGTLNGVTNITNGIDRITDPDSFGGFVHGIAQLYGGIDQTLFSGIGAGVQIGARWLNDEVKDVPVLRNVVQPFGDIVGGVGAATGDLFNGVGESWDDPGSSVEDLCKGDFGGFAKNLGDSVVDVGSGVVDAVGDAASAVGKAIGDLFSW